MKKIIPALLLLFIFTHTVKSETIISNGSIVHGVWKKNGSPYIIEGEAKVPKDSLLVINPGVTLKFKSSNNTDVSSHDFDYDSLKVGFLNIEGNLIAEGTETDSIIFTRNDNIGYWGIIRFVDNTDSTSILKYCCVKFGNFINTKGNGTITTTRTNGNLFPFLKVTDCEIRNNFKNALSLGSNANISNCNIHNNNESAVSIPGIRGAKISVVNNNISENSLGIFVDNSSSIIIKGNDIIGNEGNGIYIKLSGGLISKNLIANNQTAISLWSASPIISNNKIHSNLKAISCVHQSGPDINGNLITNTESNVFEFYTFSLLIIKNCTICDNNSTVFKLAGGSSARVHNSIIWNNKNFIETDQYINTLVSISNSIIDEQIYTEHINDLGHNMWGEDPLFMQHDGNKYFLSSESIARNRGSFDLISDLEDFDQAGGKRVCSGRIDIGAYEFQEEGDWLYIVSPNGNENFKCGDTTKIKWISNIDSTSQITCDLSTDEGLTWESVFSNEQNIGEIIWTIPNKNSDKCLLRIIIPSKSINDICDNNFKITNSVFQNSSLVYGTWSKENSPYYILGESIVPKDSTLIIEKGVKIIFKSSTKLSQTDDFEYNRLNVGMLRVKGNLLAEGTEDENIIFTRDDNKGRWGLVFIEKSAGENIFQHCCFDNSHFLFDLNENDYLGAISVDSSNINITHCYFKQNSYGVDATNTNVRINIENSTFEFNYEPAIGIFYSNAFINGNNLTGCGIQCISAEETLLMQKKNYSFNMLCENKNVTKIKRNIHTQLFKMGYNNEIIIEDNIMDGGSLECENLKKVVITNNHITNSPGYGIYLNKCNSSIIGNRISDLTPLGIRTEAIRLVYGSTFIQNNFIIDNTSENSNGIVLLNLDESHVVNNIIANNNRWGVVLVGEKYFLTNNTIVNNGSYGVKNSQATQNTIITNCLIYNNGYSFENGNATIKYSLIGSERLPNGMVDGGNNIVGMNPNFSDSSNYILSSLSPCIDAGSPDTTNLFLPNTDILGNLRLYDAKGLGSARIDIGAVEFDSLSTDVSRTNNIIPEYYNIYQNYPNPFNPITNIMYDVSQKLKIEIQIYNILGEKIRTLLNTEKPSGKYNILWDGKNDIGESVSSGIYICKFKSEKFQKHIKLTLIK